MLSDLDTILFPDECEVVLMPLHSQQVYLIHKNASSSLRKQAQKDNLQVLCNHDLRSLESVDVYLRDGRQRYASGVRTYLQHLARDLPWLDQPTAQWFVQQYPFLNRHFLPQFHWLANLARFISADTKIVLRNFDTIGNITDYRRNVMQDPAHQDAVVTSPNMDLWFFIDQILCDLSGRTLTWQQIITHYQINHVSAYDLMCKRFSQIAHCVLPQT